MTEQLKPCPFCGGEATIRREDDMWIVECRHHGWSAKDDDGCSYAGDISLYVEISGKVNHWTHEIEYAEKDVDLAKKKAIKAWNRRAESTCRPEVCDDGAGAWGVYCSECCYRFVGPYGSRDLPERMAARRDIMPHYCSNCGARVVVE